VKLAPGLRLNLSGGGASVSLGGKGLRYTVGNKGSRVTVGLPGTGLSWSQYTPHARRPRTPTLPSSNLPVTRPTRPPPSDETTLSPIESAPAQGVNALSTSELAPVLNAVHRRMRIAPLATLGCVGLFVAALGVADQMLAGLAALFVTIAIPVSIYVDRYRRSVRVDFQPDGDAKQITGALSESFKQLRSSKFVWSINSQGHTSDWKRNAGATTLVKRQKIALQFGKPTCVRGRVRFPCIQIGRTELFFASDAVLMVSSGSVAALHYRDLALSTQPTRFVEEASVPSDATVLDHTWKFVAKNGGPDRRFNSNRQLPVCRYGEMTFNSAGGLNGKIQFSNSSAGDAFSEITNILASIEPSDTGKPVASFRKPKGIVTAAFCCCFLLIGGQLAFGTMARWRAQTTQRPQVIVRADPVSPTQISSIAKSPEPRMPERQRANDDKEKRDAVGKPLVLTPANPTTASEPSAAAVPLPRPRPKYDGSASRERAMVR
jgi:hypothetical protein